MTATTPTPPPVGGRTIGLAHYAGRAVLERVLARHGLTFPQQITLRHAVVAGAPVDRDTLVARVSGELKNDPAETAAAVADLLARGLLSTDGGPLTVTGGGRALYDAVGGETGAVAARIYAGIPAEDLAATARVLAQVTRRADQELAAL
ncbi:MarR family transcriptional regulator [Streptomyces sp. NPDC058417]|uniref:helix-turn-helix domain-containing protein n=1 Tax=unclassified Streptomyces TaxID=2593676 RepID=UPI0036647C60